DVEAEVHRALELFRHLIAAHEEVRVVLGEAADAEKPVEDARALVAIDGPELGEAERELAVAPQAVLEDRDVEWAVHRLDEVVLPLDLQAGEHVVLVEPGVTGDVPQVLARDVRRRHELVAVGVVLLAPELLGDVADLRALRMPEDEAATDR